MDELTIQGVAKKVKNDDVELISFLYQDGQRYVCAKPMFDELLKNPMYFKKVEFRGDSRGNPDIKILRVPKD